MPLKSLLTKFIKVSLSIIIFILFVSLFFGIFYWLNDFFTIKKIEVIAQTKLVVNGLENFNHKNFLLVKNEDIVNKIIESNPQLEKVEVEKKFPNILIIRVELSKALTVIKVNNGFFLLSESGKIIKKTKSNTSDLPLINYYQKLDYFSFNTGNTLTYKDITISLIYLKKALSLGLMVITLDINGDHMVALKLKDKEVFFSLEKDQETQIYQFETIIKDLRIQGKSFKKLDLRFEKPIIIF